MALQSYTDPRRLLNELTALLFDLSHSVCKFRGHISGFLTACFTVTDCRPVAQPQPEGPVHRIYNPPGQGDPAVPQARGTHIC